MGYNFNYKLRNVVGREDDFTANKWVISQALVDYSNMGRIIDPMMDNIQAPYVS